MEPQVSSDDLLPLALELAGSLDARTVMRRILERSLAVAAADRATLSSLDGDRLRIEASVGLGGEVTWVGRAYTTDSLVRQPLVGELLATRRTVLGGSMTSADAFPEFREALDKVRHTATVPIVEGQQLVGMLVLSRYRDQGFVEADLPSLNAFGALAGLALRNAKLYEEATVATRRLEAATAAAMDVAALPDLPALLRRIIEHACDAASADSAAVMRLEGDDGVVEATSGVAPLGSRWPLGGEITAAIRDGKPIQVATTQKEVGGDLEQYAMGYSHALVEPLRVGGDLLGILVLGRFRGRSPFSEGEIEALGQFASLAAVVLHNGRLVHRLRETEKMKREFMDIAVHELRGPLTVIEGYTELLLADESAHLEPEARNQLATIRRQAEHARTLAEDLLVLARIESEDLGVAREPLVVAHLVSAAVDRARPRARLRAGSIDMVASEEVRAVADDSLMSRILDNLLSNAVAYSIEPPRIMVKVTRDQGCVFIRVQDNGAGVVDEDRERIFARFTRGRHIGASKGTGLGLHLSRECARRMGGDLVLEESGADRGSRFMLSLPAA